MGKRGLHKRITAAMSGLMAFSLLCVSCTGILDRFGLSEIEDYWQFDYSEEEDRGLIEGKWILKKMGFESWNEFDIPYVDTEDVPQISHIEWINIDFEGEHMALTLNFNKPTLVDNRFFTENGIHSYETWETSLTIPHGPSTSMEWQTYSTISGHEYDYNGETFTIYDRGEEVYICPCYDYYFNCVYDVKNIITDEKGEIKRLIMKIATPSYNYHYEFEREKLE